MFARLLLISLPRHIPIFLSPTYESVPLSLCNIISTYLDITWGLLQILVDDDVHLCLAIFYHCSFTPYEHCISERPGDNPRTLSIMLGQLPGTAAWDPASAQS